MGLNGSLEEYTDQELRAGRPSPIGSPGKSGFAGDPLCLLWGEVTFQQECRTVTFEQECRIVFWGTELAWSKASKVSHNLSSRILQTRAQIYRPGELVNELNGN